MANKPGNTKRNDTEMVWAVNGVITGATVTAFVKDTATLVVTIVPCVVSAPKEVTITTSGLPAGKYQLEVQTVLGGKKATYPDTGYATFSVNPDLGE